MNTAMTEMNMQAFLPMTGTKMPKGKDVPADFPQGSQESFKDTMKDVMKEEASSAKPAEKPVDNAGDEVAGEARDTIKEDTPQTEAKETDLLISQLAAALAAPVQLVETPQETVVFEQPLNLQTEVQDAAAVQSVAAEPVASEQLQMQELPVSEKKPIARSEKTLDESGETVLSDKSAKDMEPVAVKAVASAEKELKMADTAVKEQPKMTDEEAPELVSEQPKPEVETLDLSKVNIKVSEGPVQMESPKLADDMAEKIFYNVSQGKTEFNVEMNPGDMGTIHIKMVFEDGKATILMSCTNTKTEQLLMQNAEQIRMIVEQQTGSQVSVNVKEEAYQSQQDMEGRGENPNKRQQEQKPNDDDAVDAAEFLQQLRFGLVGKEV